MKNLIATSFKISMLIVVSFLILSSCSKPTKVVSIESLLDEMVDRDAVARFPEKDFRLKQESSYNRASISPEDTVGWFTNHDMNPKDTDTNFIRIEENNGQKEWVLMDHEGAGAIVRTWMPFRRKNIPTTTSNRKPDPKGVISEYQ